MLQIINLVLLIRKCILYTYKEVCSIESHNNGKLAECDHFIELGSFEYLKDNLKRWFITRKRKLKACHHRSVDGTICRKMVNKNGKKWREFMLPKLLLLKSKKDNEG